MAIFYLPELKQHAKEILLNEEESKHCVRVLRAKEGDNLTLVNGKGLSAQAIIIDANPKKCKAQPKEFTIHPATKDIHVAVCPTKNADRMEWFIEKAVELGLTKVTFLMAKNNERNLINIERLEKIAISAMKQSKRYYLPEILPMTRIDTFTAK
jgi:16S rRNA (uracil1498-N3)-methyltransferase